MTRYRLQLSVEGPVLTRSTTMGRFGVDAPVARLPDGRTYLPGSHVLGKVRHALEHISNVVARADAASAFVCDVGAWFGGKGDVERGISGRRRIFLEDLVAETDGSHDAIRTRISIDPVHGTALAGALQILEAPFRPGEKITFEGALHLVGTNADVAGMALAIERAVNWISQVGGLRSVGFGRVLEATLEPDPLPARAWRPIEGTPDRARLILRFREPFCIVERRNSRNTFIGVDVVPGGAVKGALASLLAATQGRRSGTPVSDIEGSALSRYFDAVRFTHLFPVQVAADGRDLFDHEGRHAGLLAIDRPRRWPRSLASDGKALFDVALCESAGLIDGHAPAFRPDWKDKDYALADASVGWSPPDTQLRVRTAIDPETLTAKTEALFGLQMIETGGHLWVGDVDLSDVDRAARNAVLSALLSALKDGLPGIGRSGAFAEVALLPAEPGGAVPPALEAHHVLTLQTAALLRDPDGTYAKSFDDLTGGAAALVRHFAEERLSGASFMAARRPGIRYRPWLLTEPGSVFVLKAKTGQERTLQDWLDKANSGGLDLPQGVRVFYGLPDGADATLWRACPYIRQNGYGEIAVNLPVHIDRHPGHRFQPIAGAAGEARP